MFSYMRSKKQFLKDFENGDLVEWLERFINSYASLLDKKLEVSASEKASWVNSLAYMYIVLNHNSIPDDLTVGLEMILNTDNYRRVDFVLSGLHDKKKTVMLFELKQWSSVNNTKDGFKIPFKKETKKYPKDNPLVQVSDYCRDIEKNNNNVHGKNGIELIPCAYLHNLNRDNMESTLQEKYQEYVKKNNIQKYTKVKTYCCGEINRLRKDISRTLTKGDKGQVLRLLKQGNVTSKMDENMVRDLVLNHNRNELIKLRHEQNEVFKGITGIIDALDESQIEKVIIEGGPGSGKTVLGLFLLAYAREHNKTARFLLTNKGPKKQFEKWLDSLDAIEWVFDYGKKAEPVKSDILIIDESHRNLLKKDKKEEGAPDTILQGVQNSCKLAIFLVDNRQMIQENLDVDKEYIVGDTPTDKVMFESLVSQFRCNQDDGYLSWLDCMLSEDISKKFILRHTELDFGVEVISSIEALKKCISKGYPILSYKEKNQDKVVVGNGQNNLELDWTARDEDISGGKVTNIYDVQGIEFEQTIVIVGNILSFDKSANRVVINSELKAKKDDLILNIYRVLLTRATEKCYIYCADEELSKHLKNN